MTGWDGVVVIPRIWRSMGPFILFWKRWNPEIRGGQKSWTPTKCWTHITKKKVSNFLNGVSALFLLRFSLIFRDGKAHHLSPPLKPTFHFAMRGSSCPYTHYSRPTHQNRCTPRDKSHSGDQYAAIPRKPRPNTPTIAHGRVYIYLFFVMKIEFQTDNDRCIPTYYFQGAMSNPMAPKIDVV